VPLPFPYNLRGKMQATSMDTTSHPIRRKSKSDLAHLRSLPSAQPGTSTGQVTALWKEIEAGLARGMKLREVWEAAKLDGLEIPYPQFRVYTSRLRRRRSRPSALGLQPQPALTNSDRDLPSPLPSDPFANLREQREKKKQSVFEYDPFSINKNLID
jgi:hypothetical protein